MLPVSRSSNLLKPLHSAPLQPFSIKIVLSAIVRLDLAKEERLFDAKQGAYMTRFTMSSFRTKVSKLGIKGTKRGVKVFYTRKMLEDVYNGIGVKALVDQRRKKPTKAKKRARKPSKVRR
jgi:hypothetical protein